MVCLIHLTFVVLFGTSLVLAEEKEEKSFALLESVFDFSFFNFEFIKSQELDEPEESIEFKESTEPKVSTESTKFTESKELVKSKNITVELVEDINNEYQFELYKNCLGNCNPNLKLTCTKNVEDRLGRNVTYNNLVYSKVEHNNITQILLVNEII